MKVLHGHELAEAVRRILQEEEAPRCAVAFWGREHAALARSIRAQVVLDVSMRCTSRVALEALGVGPKRVSKGAAERVRVLDGLHAKLFLGRDAAVLGSANASGNALGRNGGEPSLVEAGVLVERAIDPVAFGSMEELWGELLGRSRPIRIADHKDAPLIAAAAPARDRSAGTTASPSLLGAVLLRPDDLAGTGFIFGDHGIRSDELKVANDAYEDAFGLPPRSDGRSHVCTIDRGERSLDDALRTARRVVTFWFGRSEGIYAYHDLVRVEHDCDASYWGRRSWPAVSRPIGLSGVKHADAWWFDRKAALALAKSDRQKRWKRFVAMSSERLHAVLDAER